jgi:hypothetical protein
VVAAMDTGRYQMGACVVAGEIHVTGGIGMDNGYNRLSSVVK